MDEKKFSSLKVAQTEIISAGSSKNENRHIVQLEGRNVNAKFSLTDDIRQGYEELKGVKSELFAYAPETAEDWEKLGDAIEKIAKSVRGTRDEMLVNRLVAKWFDKLERESYEGEDAKWNFTATDGMSWEEQIENLDRLPNNATLQTESSGELYHRFGMKDLPFVMERSTYSKATRNKKGNRSAHELSKENMLGIQQALKNPVAVMESGNENGIVVITDILDKDGFPVIIPVLKNQNSGMYSRNYHKMISAYGRENFENWVEKNKELMIVFDKKRFHDMRLAKPYIMTAATTDHGTESILQHKKEKNKVKFSFTDETTRDALYSLTDGMSIQELDEAYMDALNRGDTETAQKLVEDRANYLKVDTFEKGQVPTYTIRRGKPPQKTVKVYKVFTVNESTGKPSALFVSNQNDIPVGVWLDANDTYHFQDTGNQRWYVPTRRNPNTKGGSTGRSAKLSNMSQDTLQQLENMGFIKKGADNSYTAKAITALAYRPGWHAGDLPFFPQGGMKIDEDTNYENIHRYNQVVYECEMAADEDYTEYTVKKTGENKGEVKYKDRQEMPVNGYYKFATNPMANANELGTWYISGSLKIVRPLSQGECDRILAEAGFEAQEWQQYQDADELKQIKDERGKREYERRIGGLDLGRLNIDEESDDSYKKLLDTVTYDDDGNIIPLSKRFDVAKRDARWSLTDEGQGTEQADPNANTVLDPNYMRTQNESYREEMKQRKKGVDWSKYPDGAKVEDLNWEDQVTELAGMKPQELAKRLAQYNSFEAINEEIESEMRENLENVRAYRMSAIDAKKLADKLIRTYEFAIPWKELAASLARNFNYLSEDVGKNFKEFMVRMKKTIETAMKESRVYDFEHEMEVGDIRRSLKHDPITLSERDLVEVRNRFETVTNFKKAVGEVFNIVLSGLLTLSS